MSENEMDDIVIESVKLILDGAEKELRFREPLVLTPTLMKSGKYMVVRCDRLGIFVSAPPSEREILAYLIREDIREKWRLVTTPSDDTLKKAWLDAAYAEPIGGEKIGEKSEVE